MCGIFGWSLAGAQRRDETLLRRLTDVMVHRGPDGGGYALIEAGTRQIALGHRRLSIIDLSSGAGQPMKSNDGGITLVFNGEIYNYIELREELAARGHRFRTSSDTEVIIEAWRAWGTGCLTRFRGMFAIALWDAAARKLLIARDPFGKKPLFLAEVAGGLAFSSEIAPLLDFPGVGRRFDHAALPGYLLNRYVPGPDTFFAGVKKLPPGCFCLYGGGDPAIERFFSPPLATAVQDVKKSADAVTLFRDVFEDSVRIRMRSDAPYGAYLSGGVDSSAVVAAMAKASAAPVQTFSVGFAEQKYSELEYARAIAARYSTRHEELVVTPEDFIAEWPNAVLHRGAPVGEASDIPILLLSKAASRQVKMVLTGEGADEMLGGYPKHRAERWLGAYHRLMPRALHDRLVLPLVRALPFGARRIKVLAAAAAERDPARRLPFWFGGLTPEEAGALWSGNRPAPVSDFPYSLTAGSPLRRTLFFDQTSWLPDNLLERGDRMMMAGSIEGRMPFMDTELAALAARLDDALLVGGKGGKTVLRRAMAGVLPPEILARKKIGFRVPFDIWLRGPCRDLLRDTLLSDGSKVASLLNREAVHALAGDHLEGRRNNDRVLWSLMNLEFFLRAFKPEGLLEGQDKAA
jgi:asparagine synthase (glutamine-hydrolysing)